VYDSLYSLLDESIDIVDFTDRYWIYQETFLALNNESDPQALSRDTCLIQYSPYQLHKREYWASD